MTNVVRRCFSRSQDGSRKLPSNTSLRADAVAGEELATHTAPAPHRVTKKKAQHNAPKKHKNYGRGGGAKR